MAATNPERFQRITNVTNAVTTRHMCNASCLPFSRRLNIEYRSSIPHAIINSFTPRSDGSMQLYQWMFGIDNEADWPSQMLTHFDEVITREDKAILESTDPDALIDTRRRGVECSMDSNRPGMMIRKRLFELLRRHGKKESHRGNLAAKVMSVNLAS